MTEGESTKALQPVESSLKFGYLPITGWLPRFILELRTLPVWRTYWALTADAIKSGDECKSHTPCRDSEVLASNPDALLKDLEDTGAPECVYELALDYDAIAVATHNMVLQGEITETVRD